MSSLMSKITAKAAEQETPSVETQAEPQAEKSGYKIISHRYEFKVKNKTYKPDPAGYYTTETEADKKARDHFCAKGFIQHIKG